MKTLRYIGSLAFVVGLFTCIFSGLPWYVVVADDPVVPLWLRLAVFSFLGGILTVLVTVAVEQRKYAPDGEEMQPADLDQSIMLQKQVDGSFRGPLPVGQDRWYLELEDTGSAASWRLKGEIDLRNSHSVLLQPDQG